MQVMSPTLGFMIVVASKYESRAGVLKCFVLIGVRSHPRVYDVERDLTAVKTLRKIAEQSAHHVTVKVHHHAFNHEQKLGVRLQIVQLVHPTRVEGRGSQENLIALRGQQLYTQSHHIG